jgi:hypothetical protein
MRKNGWGGFKPFGGWIGCAATINPGLWLSDVHHLF